MNEQFDNFLKRLVIASLLPNVLVWGFFEIGINHNSNPLWYFLVGPYWHFEVFIFYAVLTIVCVGIALACLSQLTWLAEYAWKAYEIYQSKREKRTTERIQVLEQAAYQRARDEERLAFEALPKEEQLRIINEQRAAEEQRLAERQRQIDELEKRRLEKEEQAKREKEAELERIRALENSPDYQRKKALRSIVGGRLE